MTQQYSPERRRASSCPPVVLSQEQLELIIEQASDRAVQKMTSEAYQLVGKTVITKAMWIIGLAVVALTVWLARTDRLP